jgi:hypothetical protein
VNIELYRKLFDDMMFAEDFTFGFVSGAPHRLFIRSASQRITFDRLTNTISLPDLEPTKEEEVVLQQNNNPLSPLVMVQLLRNLNRTSEYYVPHSEEDGFQASTMSDNVLPYELVHKLELLLGLAKEEINKFSVDRRRY